MQMIERVRRICAGDDAIVSAVMYGSFARGEGDEFSDIEFYLFVDDAFFEAFDLGKWIQGIAPVAECFPNEFGTTVALFSNLIRGEFHACPASSMLQVRNWSDNVWTDDPGSMIILDRTGELRTHVDSLVGNGPDRSQSERVAILFCRFVDWIIFGTNVLRRGESSRALDLLGYVHRHLLWMVRIVEKTTDHYPTPSKGLENDISAEAYHRLVQCTARLDVESLQAAYETLWSWGKELIAKLSNSCGAPEPKEIIEKVNQRFSEWR